MMAMDGPRNHAAGGSVGPAQPDGTRTGGPGEDEGRAGVAGGDARQDKEGLRGAVGSPDAGRADRHAQAVEGAPRARAGPVSQAR